MKGNRARNEAAVPSGSLLRLGDDREIAIYQRDGVGWIADFRGARAELFTVGEWFALNGRGSLLRRLELDSVAPLSARVIERIERLHRTAERPLFVDLIAVLQAGLARLSREFSCRAPGAFSPRS